MARKAVRNPFKKEQKLPFWVRYFVACVIGLWILFCFVGSEKDGAPMKDRGTIVRKNPSKHDRAHKDNKRAAPKIEPTNAKKVDKPESDTKEQHRPSKKQKHERKKRDKKKQATPKQVKKQDGNKPEKTKPQQEYGDGTDDTTKNKESGDEKQNKSGDGSGDTDDGSHSNSKDETDDEKPRPNTVDYPELKHDEDFYPWMHHHLYHKLDFDKESIDPDVNWRKLKKSILEESLALGCDYMARHQDADTGNFHYQYDFVKDEYDPSDSPVRQAGALWGMALCFRSNPEKSSYQLAVEKGLLFFHKHTAEGPIPNSSSMVMYPDFEEGSPSGVNALYGLAMIDYLETMKGKDESYTNNDLEDQLATILNFLKYLQDPTTGHFSEAYLVEKKVVSEEHSSYYDGEALLCLVRATRYYQKHTSGDATTIEDSIRLIERTVLKLAKAYTIDAWRLDSDSDETKGFYQWSSMVFREYYEAQWSDYERVGDVLLVLAHWIIHEHGILERNKNTGYAYEGILSAYKVAEERYTADGNANDAAILHNLSKVVREGLYKLTSWQVGGPLADENDFLEEQTIGKKQMKLARGGIMNAEDEPELRIDTTQHQMHAVMMALDSMYKGWKVR